MKKMIGTQTDLKHSNYGRVLSLIKKEGLISKSDISKQLNLSIVTVTKVCDNLISRGFCHYSALMSSTGGRRPMGVEFNPESRHIAVVDMSNEGFLYIALADLDWKVVADISTSIKEDHIQSILDTIEVQLTKLCSDSALKLNELLGCVVSIPGVENKRTGEIDTCNIESLLRVSLSGRLNKILDIPVMVENDADLAAMGFYNISRIENLMYLHFTEGIGLGMVVNGRLHTGAMGFAGELASFKASDFNGEFNVLEDYASEQGFLNYYRTKCNDQKASDLNNSQLLDCFIKSLEKGSSQEQEMIDVVCRQLGNLLALLIDLFNPEQVILGGAEKRFIDLFLPGISRHVREHSTLSRFSDIEILYREGGTLLIVEGGASMYFESWLNKLEF